MIDIGVVDDPDSVQAWEAVVLESGNGIGCPHTNKSGAVRVNRLDHKSGNEPLLYAVIAVGCVMGRFSTDSWNEFERFFPNHHHPVGVIAFQELVRKLHNGCTRSADMEFRVPSAIQLAPHLNPKALQHDNQEEPFQGSNAVTSLSIRDRAVPISTIIDKIPYFHDYLILF